MIKTELTLCNSSEFIQTKRNSISLRAPVPITRFRPEHEIIWKFSELPIDHKIHKFSESWYETRFFRHDFVGCNTFFIVTKVLDDVFAVQTPEVLAAWSIFFSSAFFKSHEKYIFCATLAIFKLIRYR